MTKPKILLYITIFLLLHYQYYIKINVLPTDIIQLIIGNMEHLKG